jgi:hypothetical protein
LGSFLAYQSILQELNRHFPKYQLKPQNIDDFRIDANDEWSHHTFLKLAGLNPDQHKDDTYLTLHPENTDHYAADSKLIEHGIYDGTIPAISIGNTNPRLSCRNY